MKLKIKILFCFFFLITLIFSIKELTLSYSSKVSLIYDGKSKTFSYSKTDDLFENFKDLMPGDKRTQLIYIDLENIVTDSNMYLKLEEVEILRDLIIKIYKDDILLFDNVNNVNSYDQLIKIYENNKPKQFYLKIDLEVPNTIGNEVQDSNFNFKWRFLVEDNGSFIDAPQTFEATNSYYYLILMLLSLIVIILIIISIIKDLKKNKKEVL